jgi:tetratricopeptide (TPR) repeat protein
MLHNYAETAIVLRAAARHNFTGQWIHLHNALRLIREGSLDDAEALFEAIAATGEYWEASANLGRILESRLAPSQAIAHYEKAASAVMAAGRLNDASRIQVRIAHCLKTMGRLSDSRRVLEYALELNPDNLNARLELSRLDQ